MLTYYKDQRLTLAEPWLGLAIQENPSQPGRAVRQHFRGTSGTNRYYSQSRGN
ncbi:Hypothetical protein Cp1002B_1673 [Corynebacterium pseudotuberculosis]|nr:Hypothetical protein Cp1002B_1673 [Corynebacterium pseudotuberculosis]ALP33661.1 Hypothetical protein CpN1_0977 [Corynebacterium pseudotuberculosis]APA72681.1 Hypothetical protein CpMEX29_0971 [Corynebacterium pseudotuberculosis]ARB43167.1 Hypothetical protein CpSigmaE_1653 [Corynebacterium pseudotuberculosis]QBI72905.1 Hypothetical protein Cp38MAT_1003 [Corynebacterium pseudotuberculosis]